MDTILDVQNKIILFFLEAYKSDDGDYYAECSCINYIWRIHRLSEDCRSENLNGTVQRIELQDPCPATLQQLAWIIEDGTCIHDQHQGNRPEVLNISEKYTDSCKEHSTSVGRIRMMSRATGA